MVDLDARAVLGVLQQFTATLQTAPQSKCQNLSVPRSQVMNPLKLEDSHSLQHLISQRWIQSREHEYNLLFSFKFFVIWGVVQVLPLYSIPCIEHNTLIAARFHSHSHSCFLHRNVLHRPQPGQPSRRTAGLLQLLSHSKTDLPSSSRLSGIKTSPGGGYRKLHL